MRFSTLFGATTLSVALPLLALADGHGHARRHDSIARRARGDVSEFEKRSFTNARFTFYDVGLGACGKNNVPSDFIVALNSAQYGGGYPGPNCFKSITIQANGKTHDATIMDECPGCPYGGLDFSRGLFDSFADESVGVLYGTWWFNDGSGGGGDDTPAPPTTHKTTPKPTPTPTPTTHKETPTPTPTPDPTTSHTPTTSATPSTSEEKSSETPSSSSHPSSSHSSSSSSHSSTPSATPSSTSSGLGDVNQAFLGLAGLVVAGADAAN